MRMITIPISKDKWAFWKDMAVDIDRSFPKKLLKHFLFYDDPHSGKAPLFVSYTSIDWSMDYSELSPVFLVEIDQPNEFNYTKYKERVQSKSIATISSGDLFYLASETVLKEQPALLETIKDQDREYAFPFSVLNRYLETKSPLEKLGLTDTLSTSLRSDDLDIFVISNGKKYILKKKPGKIECEMIPEDKRHGYTSGVIFSDKDQLILFWTIGW